MIFKSLLFTLFGANMLWSGSAEAASLSFATHGIVKYHQDYLTLSTGNGSRSGESLGNWLNGDRTFLEDLAEEGSAISFLNLDPGRYEIEWDMVTTDLMNDAFYLWDGLQVTTLSDRKSATIFLIDRSSFIPKFEFSTGRKKLKFNITGDRFALIAADTRNAWGDTAVKLYSVNKVSANEPSLLFGASAVILILRRNRKFKNK